MIPTGPAFEEEARDIAKEAEIHKKLVNDNIVRYLSCYQASHHLCILMELAPGGSLYEQLKSLHMQNGQLSEQEVLNRTRQVASGVAYLHSQNIIHRDLRLGMLIFTHLLEHLLIKHEPPSIEFI